MPAARSRAARDRAGAGEARGRPMRYHAFVQGCFDRHWTRFREHARWRGVELIGDVRSSSSTTAPTSGEPRDLPARRVGRRGSGRRAPDYFSVTGQLWVNPLYRWTRSRRPASSGGRPHRTALPLRLLRLDHFIGFHRAWGVPRSATTAIEGAGRRGPEMRSSRAGEEAERPAAPRRGPRS